MRAIALFLFLLSNQGFIESIGIRDLQVPGHAAEGGEALLGCQFDLHGDTLYSVKWYKDGREFYRYMPGNNPPITCFPAPGVEVDLSRSSMNVVTLVHLNRASAGVYSCEVSGEAPSFDTISLNKLVSIYFPEEGPTISGLQDDYNIGDTVTLNCTSPPSRPDAQLKWLLNGVPVPEEYVYGPWYKATQEEDLAPFQTKLKLHFRVTPDHFVDGTMTIMCQSIIAPLYNKESHYTYNLVLPAVTEQPLSNEASHTAATMFSIAFLFNIVKLLLH
ncbi:endothelial cell-selective adhesion molecule-like isoform X2 [Amyelois transitella]|uniref:endothelial cell-selective adhesion molecule-like isoform X2 n=1 Tax=Amyelois transitella TaxID=680683 RepID=UPI00299032C6|nr:endothelial cell-selective adhesion molecule-like isoform X2 [Amyelois transitella]